MKKKTAITAICVLAAAVVGLGALSIWQGGALARAERVSAIYGEQALGELESSLYSMDAAMRRSLYATDSALAAQLCAEAAAYAEASLTALRSLPCVTHEMERLMGAVNTAGDYALSVSRSASRGTAVDETTRTTLKALSATVSSLAGQTTTIRAALADNALVLDGYAQCSDAGSTNTVGYELRHVEAELPEPEELSYDGRYAALAAEAAAETIDESAARRTAAKFLGLPEQRLISRGMSAGTDPVWWFAVSVPEGEEQRIGVDAVSGDVAEWSDCALHSGGELGAAEARAAAAEFLAERGLGEAEALSARESEGECLVTLAAKAGEALRLGSVCRVAVDRESGEVCSYVASRSKAQPPEELSPVITREDAAAGLTEGLMLRGTRLVTIESPGHREKLCWELTADDESAGRVVTIYVNALTGGQEKIELSET